MDPKDIYRSKTILGIVCMLLSLILPQLGVKTDNAQIQAWAQNIVALVGMVLAIYGRASIPGQALRIGSLVLGFLPQVIKVAGVQPDKPWPRCDDLLQPGTIQPLEPVQSTPGFEKASGGSDRPGGFVRLDMARVLAALGVVALLCFSLPGCAQQAQQQPAFAPPAVCAGAVVDGAYTGSDSVILRTLPDPTRAGVLLQIVNVAAIRSDYYSAAQALAAIAEIDAALDKAGSYNALSLFVTQRLADANAAAGLAVLEQTGLLARFNSAAPLSACDVALLRAHLANQRLVVLALTGGK